MDQELSDAAAYMRLADHACALTRWQHFYVWNDDMAATLKIWRQIENPTPSVDVNLVEEYSFPNFIQIWFETSDP